QRSTDHLAHCAFRHGRYRAFLVAHVKQIIRRSAWRGAYAPKDGKVDVNDILVAGQHQSFFRHYLSHGNATRVAREAHAYIDAVEPRNLRRNHLLDRVGQVIVQSGLHQAIDLAKSENHAVFVRLHAENPGESPYAKTHHGNQGNGSRPKIAARVPRLESLPQTLEKFI